MTKTTRQDAGEHTPGGPPRYDGPMVRLHNPQNGIQILTSEDKATRLLATGAYLEGALPAPKANEQTAR